MENNFFDQFDSSESNSTSADSSGNFFDQFDASKPKRKKIDAGERSVGDIAKDVGITALKGVISVPEAIIGLADIPTGGQVGKALDEWGFRPGEAKQVLDEAYSEPQQAANRAVREAEGFVDTASAAIQNPSTIATTVGESIPQMLGGAAVARGLLKVAPKIGAVVAGAAGEGLVGAGSAASSIRRETDDGLLTAKQSAVAAATGVGTGLIGAAGGKLAQKLGIGDVDTILAQGGADLVQKNSKGFARQLVEGGVTEGVFEELPQSIQEQMLQNYALDKPITEGVGNAAAMGMLSGVATGGAAGVYNAAAGRTAQPAATTTEETSNSAVQEAIGPIANAQQSTAQDSEQRLVEIELLAEQRELTPDEFAEYEKLASLVESEQQRVDSERALNAESVEQSDTLSTPDANSVASTNDDEAVRALKSPVQLTALDRAQELDGEIGRLNERLTELSPENGYSETFDAERNEVATRAQELTLERDDIAKTWPKAVPGIQTEFSTESGAKIQGQYAIMDAGDLVTSNDENLKANPLYPKELQPRDRSRQASEIQISGIVGKLDPARLGVSADAATGAPIVGADGLVESGNARSIALKRVYQANGQKAEDYKAYLRANAQQFGLSPEKIDQVQKPVLVRVRSTPVNRAEFARQANASTVQRMSPSESAMSDASRISSLEGLTPDENGDFDSSIDFIRQFMATLPITEQSDMLESDGKLSTSGYRRIQNAVLAKAYGDSGTLRRMTESRDDNLRNITKALTYVAPTIASARERISAGSMYDADIASDLIQAVEGLSSIKQRGWTVDQELAQTDLTGPRYSPEASELLTFLDQNIRSPRRIAEFMQRYYEALESAGDPNQGTMFDEPVAPTRQDLLDQARGNNVRNAEDTQRGVDSTTSQAVEESRGQPEDAPSDQGGNQGDEGTGQRGGTGRENSSGKDQGWVAFPKDSGTLGIPRAEMPQIKSEARGALVQFLKARGVSSESKTVPASTLKATQAEYSQDKVDRFVKSGPTDGSRSVLISNDGHVLDGHHQWMAFEAMGKDVAVIQLDAPIEKLLEMVKEFPSVQRSEGVQSESNKPNDSVSEKKVEEKPQFPTISQIKAPSIGPMGAAKITPIASGKPLYRQTNLDGLDDVARYDNQSEAINLFVTDNVDLALGQAGNKGVLIEFRPDSLSGTENVKPGTGDASGREYKANVMANRTIAAVTMKAVDVPRLRGVTRNLLKRDFTKSVLGNGFVQYKRNGVESSGATGSIANKPVKKSEVNKSGNNKSQSVETGNKVAGKAPVESDTALSRAPSGVDVKIKINSPKRKASNFGEARAAAKDFQGEPLTNLQSGLVAVVSRNTLDKMLSSKAVSKSESASAHSTAVANLDELFANATWGWSKTDAENDPNIKAIHRLFAPMLFGGKALLAKITVKETAQKDRPNPLYTVEAVEFNEGSPAAQWVGEIAKADGIDPRTIRSAGDVLSVAKQVQNYKSSSGDADNADNADIRLSRSSGGGVDITALEKLAASVKKRLPNLPEVVVLGEPYQAPKALREFIVGQGAVSDVEGAFHNGKLYLFASGLSDLNRAEFVLAEHEAAHFGLRAIFGDRLKAIMNQIYNENASVRKTASALQAKGKLNNAQATEEVLVDMPSSELIRLKGWRKLTVAIRNWLDSIGFSGLAGKLENWLNAALDDQQRADLYAADLVRAARAFVAGKDLAHSETRLVRTVAMLSRGGGGSTKIKSASGINLNGNMPPAPGPKQLNRYTAAKKKLNDLLSPENIDAVIYNIQDRFIDLKRLRDHIKKIGGTVSDLNDAYLGEELYHKRLSKRVENFLADEIKPLMAEMRLRSVSTAEFEQYLHARHAPEANKVLAERNPNQVMINKARKDAADKVKNLQLQLQSAKARGTATKAIDDALANAQADLTRFNMSQAFKGTEAERNALSGMSDSDAASFMSSLIATKKKAMQDLAAKVDSMNEKTLLTLERYGLETKQTLDAWRNEYKHYVPLYRDEAHADSGFHPIGQGFSTKGSAAKSRTGSSEKVTNILGHIAMQREAALTRGEKNRVAKQVYLLAMQNKDPNVWEVDKPPTSRTVDAKTGFVRTGIDPTYRNKPNVLMVRIAGKDRALVFNEQNPQALRAVGALKNLDMSDLGALVGMVQKGTRWFASVNTQYNPVFGLINFARDVQSAILNLSTTPIAGKEKEVTKHIAGAMRAIYRDTRGKPSANKENAEWMRLWSEMQLEGGATGYRELFANAEDRAKALIKEIDALDRGMAKKAAYAVVDWLSDYNETMENAVRVAAYKTALDQGLSKPRAASISKNLTVNFNRKGAKGQTVGAWYAFFNAAIQGTTRMVETLSGPAGRKIIFGGVALGMLSSMLAMTMMGGLEGDEEDDEYSKIPDFLRERSLIIPLGATKYIAFPLPLGFHVIPNIGRIAMETAFGRQDIGAGKRLIDMMVITAEAFNPIGGFGTPSQMIAPTVLDPIAALAENTDWSGSPIYRDNFNGLNPTPGFTRTKDSASAISKGLAEVLNKVSGGTDYMPGMWSPTPDQIDYIIGQLTGGVGRETLKAMQFAAAPFTGDEVPAYKIPILGRVYGTTEGPSGQAGKFYENLRDINMLENEIKGRAKDGKDYASFMEEKPEATLFPLANALERQVRALREARRLVIKDGLPGSKDEAKEYDERITEAMKRLNQEVQKARDSK